MKIYRDTNNFTEKTEVEPIMESVRELVDQCLAAAMNRPKSMKDPPAEAWFEVIADDFKVSIGMQTVEQNYVYVKEGVPSKTPEQRPKGFLGLIKAMASVLPGREITAGLTKDEVISLMVIVLTGDLIKIESFLNPYDIYLDR